MPKKGPTAENQNSKRAKWFSEVLHAEFHDRMFSNLGDYVAQTNRQTDKQTDKQTDNAIYIVDVFVLREVKTRFRK